MTTSLRTGLEAPLLRLGRAVMDWEPNKFLRESIFEYVTDVVPFGAGYLKHKGKFGLRFFFLVGAIRLTAMVPQPRLSLPKRHPQWKV